MIQLILHLIGDYVLQSQWTADNKTKSTWAAFVHATLYSLLFLLIASPKAFLVIWSTHLLIDRFRLARYVVYAKNFLSSPSHWKMWRECSQTGYHKDLPLWLSVWLMIVCDNTIHMALNYLAILLF